MSVFVRKAYEWFISLRCAIYIIIAIATLAIVGTLLPQGMLEEVLREELGEGSLGVKLLVWLGLTDFYHSPMFQGLLVLLAVNMLLCTVERFPKTVKRWSQGETHLSGEELMRFSHARMYSSERSYDEVVTAVEEIMREKRWHRSRSGGSTEGGEADGRSLRRSYVKHRYAPFAVYVVHLSILVILLGGIVGSLWGFKGMMTIIEGETATLVRPIRGTRAIVLPFEVRCDDFEAQFYPDGSPREVASQVSIVEHGREVRRAIIRVNHPLTHRGLRFSQATYGSVVNRAVVALSDADTGTPLYELTLVPDREEVIPGTAKMIQLLDYQDNLGGFGPAVAIGMVEDGQEPEGAWALLRFPHFHGSQLGPYRVMLRDVSLSSYTGLQVVYDPGRWIVVSGLVFLTCSVLLTFYTAMRKVVVVVEDGGRERRIYLAGITRRSVPLSFQAEWEGLCKRLGKVL